MAKKNLMHLFTRWRALLLAGGATVTVSGIIVGNWAIRIIGEGLAIEDAEMLDAYVKEREKRFVRAMNMGSAMDGDDENP
jgi:hypothetical protein